MNKRESKREALQGGGFLKGSTAGLSEMLLGWRSLFLGVCGMLGGFAGAVTGEGIVERLVLVVIGCVSLVLAAVSWKYMKRQQNERNAQRDST